MPKYVVKIKLTFLAETIVQVDNDKKQTELQAAKLIAEAQTAAIARENLENIGAEYAPIIFRLAEMKTLSIGRHTNASIQQPEPLIITSKEMTTIDLKEERVE